jgi:alkanesulfonate monooxygenase SsuD/methylene tetrahydromethanopterin reductase-like flavin-dependent oxidoreductase (luciferase family)
LVTLVDARAPADTQTLLDKETGLKLDLQLNPATTPWPVLREAALEAEAVGFDTLWTWDHLSGAMLAGETMLECFTLLGALAEATTSIRLGTLVVNVANRHAGLLATAAASAQTLSGGRLTLGLGAGASPNSPFAAEQRALGVEIPPRLADRHQRLIDALDLLDAVWALDRDPRWAGFPRPDPRPPLLLGVNSRSLAEVAGLRTQGINVRASHPDLAGILATAEAARATRLAERPIGTDAAGMASAWTSSVWDLWDDRLLDPTGPRRRHWAELGIDRLVLVCVEHCLPAQLRDLGPLH